jgi:transposase
LFAQTPPGERLGKAVAYTLDNWKKLIRYVEDPLLVPSNNRAENAIRPFVVGCKNWLLAGTTAAAKASAVHYSQNESAKLAQLYPYMYLRHAFSWLPYTKTNEDRLRFMPGNLTPDLVRGG